MKAYKAFNKDLTCNGFQFEVGKTYEHIGEVVPCKSGFHFCMQLKDVYNYYERNYCTRICEIEYESCVTEGDKSVTAKITIVRELLKDEIKALTDDLRFNSGYYNSGSRNSGNYNSGSRNSGYYNSGSRNSGSRNSGHYNSGDSNSGDSNSGHYNSGYSNSGYYNSGHYNSGHYNSGHYNSGYFNTDTPKVRLFNTQSELDFNDERLQKINSIIVNYWKQHLTWVSSENMTDEEKQNNKSHETTGGFLRKSENDYKKSWAIVWEKCSAEEKECFKSLPNFNAEIFYEITGIRV
jgi:hypothetical protein